MLPRCSGEGAPAWCFRSKVLGVGSSCERICALPGRFQDLMSFSFKWLRVFITTGTFIVTIIFRVGGETLPLRFCVFAGILSGHGRLPWQE